MNKFVVSTLVVLSMATLPTLAQSNANANKKDIGKKVSKFLKNAKSSMENIGHELGDAIGFDDRVGGTGDDLIKVDGNYYMPIYDTNLYKDSDYCSLKNLCKEQFVAKYPKATITSVALPQERWISKTVSENDSIIGFQQTMYCYVIARDGTDGYINAKFVFGRSKKVGADYKKAVGMWPKWERTDVIPMNVYSSLKGQ